MKKVAIVTIYNEMNFGNRLQNYAVQKTLEKMGFFCESIAFLPQRSLIKRIKQDAKAILCRTLIDHWEESRRQSFLKFSRKAIKTRYIPASFDRKQLADEYDFFVIGSDQVWNPCFGGFEEIYDDMFLTYIPSDKIVCFSPSFGVSKIPEEWKKAFAKGLNRINRISVREEAGCQIVKELTGKEAVCMIDPTLMLDQGEWMEIAAIPKIENYVFSYFLGEIPDDLQRLIHGNLKNVDLLDRKSKNYYRFNPADFVGLIAKSEFVITDSFHACVFSIIFGKPFYYIDRKDNYRSMSSRLDTLLSMWGKQIEGTMAFPITISESERDEVLQIRRKEAVSFLKEQLC